MSSENHPVLDQIIEFAKDSETYEELLELSASSKHETLYTSALDSFGSWDAALVEALHHALNTGDVNRSRRAPEGPVERRVTEAFNHPVYIATQQNKLYMEKGSELSVSDALYEVDGSGDERIPRALFYLGQSDAVFLFSNLGRYYGMDARLMPSWDVEGMRSIRDILFLEAEESIEFMTSRRALYEGRVIHITRQAKGKATDVSDFPRDLDKTAREAFLLNEGDAPCAVMVGTENNSVLCASAMGQAIHFDASDMRSMGRKAVGVNVMRLQGDDDCVVGGFLGASVKQFVVMTESGLGKRLDLSEFRQQGRGGAGMQLIRLNVSDRVVAISPCNAAEDIAIMTNAGRVQRVPTTTFQLLGRAAKGTQIVDLSDGERVVGLTALPCGSASSIQDDAEHDTDSDY